MLNGNAPFSFSFMVNTPSQPLMAGPHSFSLRYGGTARWSGSASSAQMADISKGETATTVIATSPTVLASMNVTFTAGVSTVVKSLAPTGSVQFYDGATALGAPVTLTAGNAAYMTAALAAGMHSITSLYSGDANFTASTSPPISEAIQDAVPQISVPTLTTAPGGTVTETLTILSLGGLNETTTFSCSGLPQGANCIFAPNSITGSGSTTLTISTSGPSVMVGANGSWFAEGGAALACVILFVWPKNRRRHVRLLAILVLGTVLSPMGCGGGNFVPGRPATPAGTSTITVTTTTGSGATVIVKSITFQLIVT
jgi:hypothetical protein